VLYINLHTLFGLLDGNDPIISDITALVLDSEPRWTAKTAG
jgi:hypothetical protein